MQAVHVTLLQSATLGRQTLAPGVSLHVPSDVAQAWVRAGIAASNQPLAHVESTPVATETIATSDPEPQLAEPAKAAQHKRGKRGT